MTNNKNNTKTQKAKVVNSPKTRLTLRQKRFIKHYMETGNGTKSAILAGYSKPSAHVIAHGNLRNAKILAKLEDATEQAEEVVLSLMHTGETGELKLKAAREVLDRTIGKPIQRSESVSVNISVETMLGAASSEDA